MKTEHIFPGSFVFLTDIDNTIIESSRYYSDENFLGRRAPGYNTPRIICTKEAAVKLKLVNNELKKQGYIIVVYDGYRPQRTVNEFIRWGQDENDNSAKARYYPTLNKNQTFDSGYLPRKTSTHSRGSTFDLTIMQLGQKLKDVSVSTRILPNGDIIPFLDDNTVDMGSSFDLFHEISHHDTIMINQQQTSMRNLLRNTMKAHGFQEYRKEWWHYCMENEPYPETYFDFVWEGPK